MTTVIDRVHRGAALLDERGPADWRSRVDRTTLDLRDPGRCVVGQAYRVYLIDGSDYELYDHALRHLGASRGTQTHAWAVERGFETDGYADYLALTVAWRNYLARTTHREEVTE